MSAARDELHHLVDNLSDDEVPTVLAELRMRTAQPIRRPWPPPWFGAGKARDPHTSSRVDEILRDELGRRPA
jgi:hypothetical protein